MPRAAMPDVVTSALGSVGLGDLPLDTPTSALSGGQTQRLALAGTLALDPSVVLLDEPTAMLDPASAREVRYAVGRLVGRESGSRADRGWLDASSGGPPGAAGRSWPPTPLPVRPSTRRSTRPPVRPRPGPRSGPPWWSSSTSSTRGSISSTGSSCCPTTAGSSPTVRCTRPFSRSALVSSTWVSGCPARTRRPPSPSTQRSSLPARPEVDPPKIIPRRDSALLRPTSAVRSPGHCCAEVSSAEPSGHCCARGQQCRPAGHCCARGQRCTAPGHC